MAMKSNAMISIWLLPNILIGTTNHMWDSRISTVKRIIGITGTLNIVSKNMIG